MTYLFLRIASSLLFHNFLALTLTRAFCFCRLVAAVKARVARLEIVVSNISLAKLIERIMQVDRPLLKRCLLCLQNRVSSNRKKSNPSQPQPLPDPASVSSQEFLRLEREQAALKIQVSLHHTCL